MYGKKASMERQNSNGLIKNFKRECQSENVSKALRITCVFTKLKHNYMNDSTWDEMIGQDSPTKRAEMVRRRVKLTERNNKFLEDMEAMECDPNTLINLALSVFIPKTYNQNFNLDEIIKQGRK